MFPFDVFEPLKSLRDTPRAILNSVKSAAFNDKVLWRTSLEYNFTNVRSRFLPSLSSSLVACVRVRVGLWRSLGSVYLSDTIVIMSE